jgi:hypothetical protein
MSWESLALPVILSLAGALVALLAWANRKWGVFVDSKVESDYFNGVLKKLAELVTTVVLELKQTIVDQLKYDEEWDEETAAEVKAQAIAMLKEYLGPKGLAEVMEVFGISDGTLLDQLLSSFIEAKVAEVKEEL